MDHKTVRTLLVAAFAMNLAFLAFVLADYAAWDGAYAIPIFIAWAIVIVLSIVLGLFAKPRIQVVERVVERVVVAPDARSASQWSGPSPPQPASAPAAPAPKPASPPPGLAPATPRPTIIRRGPFTFNGYTLHSRTVELKGGGKRPIYFFAKSTPKSGSPAPKPDGYHVGVNERTGLPFLKKGAGPDGEDLTPEAGDGYEPQCAALTEEGAQCRNSARHGSKYCSSHFGYQPPTAGQIAAMHDTLSSRDVVDVGPALRGRPAEDVDGEQCGALTAAGDQCRNAARDGSKYCAAHKGYQPPTAQAVALRSDTKPRVRGAKDTKPSVRKSR